MWARLALVIAAIVATLTALELAMRAIKPGGLSHWSNLVLEARTVLAATEQRRFEHSDRLGVVPRGGLRGGERMRDGEAPLLAVGDSYTYGEEVGDSETWPAHLERALGRSVLNGGVSSYGFDQIVLRAELLATERKPAMIAVAFIADDIHRTEMRRMWGAEKPYFDIVSDDLVLRNVPVPLSPDPRTTLTFSQRTLGYSHLFDFILRRLDLLHGWFGDHVRVHPVGAGERISCLLTARLAELQQRSSTPVLLVAQYDPVVWQDPVFAAEQRRLTVGLLRCATNRGLATIDTFDALAARTADMKRLYAFWHMSDEGNRLIASVIAAKIR